MAQFEPALTLVLKHEGSEYTDHPADNGGATRHGITLNDLRRYRGDLNLTKDAVKELTVEEAGMIYKAFYWDPMKLTQVVSQASADLLFNQAVLTGNNGCTRRLQLVLMRLKKSVSIDGKMGPKTIQAINSVDPVEFCVEFCIATQEYLLNIVINNPTQIVFLKGWLRRSHSLLRHIFEIK